MTISSSTRKAGPFPGNGVTVAYPFTFKVFTQADVLAVQAVTATGIETPLALGTNYTITLNGDQNANPGGTLTMLVAAPTGSTVTLTSQVANTQETSLTNLGGFYPAVINDALDRLVIQIQQLSEKVGRSVKVGISSSATPDELIASIQDSATSAAAAADAAEASAQAAANAGPYRTSATGSLITPSGTTAQRDATPQAGFFRYNTTTLAFEGYSGAAWGSVGGGATGGGSDRVFHQNGQTVNTTYSIPAGQNAMSAGPVTVANGVTVTVPTGATWTVV